MTYLIVIILILLSATFSGLTLGFFSLNKDDLQRKAKLGNKKAKKIYSVRKNGNLLLCTLLIGNVAVNSAISIFLGSIASGFTAGLVATALIVVFGEVVPQASFSRYALTLGAKFVWLVRIFIFVLFPICWPMAWILNKILGEEMATIYSKKELSKMIEQHASSNESSIDSDEKRIMKGALSFSEKTVKNIMTPKEKIVMLKHDKKLNERNIAQISNYGHSRIPVYETSKDNIIGLLYVKDLLPYKHEDLDKKTVGEMSRQNVITTHLEETLDDLLNDFKESHNHLFIVINKAKKVSGIVTIEDVIEEILGTEIIDEYDVKK